jgi:hypothetical protein
MAATLNAVSDFISKVGFPIAVAGFVLWQYFSMHRVNEEILRSYGGKLDRILALLEQLAHK